MAGIVLDRWDWLLVSIIVGTFASLIRWFVANRAGAVPPDGESASVGAWQRLDAILASPWLATPLRLIYAIGLPAFALFWQSALSARGLGLQPLPLGPSAPSLDGLILPTWADWVRDLGWTMGVGAAFWIIVTLGDAAARSGRAVRAGLQGSGWVSGARSVLPGASPSQVVEDAAATQVHWAFYREPFIYAWGTPLGIWLGALPVLFEVAINPRFWEKLHDEGAPAIRSALVQAGIFVATALVTIRTQNLWMGLALGLIVGPLAVQRGPRTDE